MDRPTRECAEILMAALSRCGSPNRKEILTASGLNHSEFDRALKCLRTAGVLRRCDPRPDAPASDIRYELTGKPLSMLRPPRQRPRAAGLSFDRLLAAWAAVPSE